MNRKDLINVMSRAAIRGVVDNCVLFYEDNKFNCNFVSGDKSLAGYISTTLFEENFVGDSKVGLSNLDGFIKAIKTLGDDITISLSMEGRAENILMISDSLMTTKHNLIADSQLPSIPRVKKDVLSMAPSRYPLTKEFVNKFLKSTTAVADCKHVYVTSDDNFMVLGLAQSTDLNTGIVIKCPLETVPEKIDFLAFDLKVVKLVMATNKFVRGSDLVSGILDVHPNGLMNLEYKYGDHTIVNYFIVAEK